MTALLRRVARSPWTTAYVTFALAFTSGWFRAVGNTPAAIGIGAAAGFYIAWRIDTARRNDFEETADA